MKSLIVLLASLLLAGLIVSPFFWLKFLKEKNVIKYLFWSSVLTLILFVSFFLKGDDLLGHFFTKIDADLYYFYDDISGFFLIIMPFLFLISPFIFAKILYKKNSVRLFIISLSFSFLIFVLLALFFIYYIVPAVGGVFLHNI